MTNAEAMWRAAEREADSQAHRRARHDALRAIAADLPEPETYARYVPLVVAEVLTSAWQLGGPGNIGVWRVTEGHAPALRKLGLVEFGGCCVTVFGMQVRQALLREDG